MQNALPLPGDVVWIRRRRWRVERARRDRHVVRLDVASRDRRLTFLAPFDRPVAPAARAPLRRVRTQEALARVARLIARAPDGRLPLALLDAGADILPHQIEPCLAVLAGHARLLLADEVGLGKTIQAGLILAELLRRDAATRVLLLVPASLRDQWQMELRSRFAIACLTADRRGLEAEARAGAFGENPWGRAGVWLASPDFLKQPHVIEGLPAEPWDLVVIDEAHGVCGDSDRYAACHHVASRARRVVQLTATPHSGDAGRFSRLVNLGRVGPRDPDVLVFRRTRKALGVAIARRIRWHRVSLGAAESETLAGLEAFERAVLSGADADGFDRALLLLSVLRKRALSTFAALSQSLSRRLAWLGEPPPEAGLLWMQPRLAFDEDADEAAIEEQAALTVRTGIDPARERTWLRRLRHLADHAARRESKVGRLTALIARTTEPVVVFTEFRDSIDVIRRQLRSSRAVSVLHGGQDRSEQRLQLRRFLDGASSVLLATDVAGQGLNLQSRARWVISLELPWNPARLEQRIGRVDRLGQPRPTRLTLLIARHEMESGLLSHLAKRVLGAQREFASDALQDLAPREADVRAALLAPAVSRSPIGEPQADQSAGVTAPAITRRWSRQAATAARNLILRRELAKRWRGPDADGGRKIQACAPRLVRSLGEPGRAVLLCSTPLLNGSGELVEQLVSAVSVPPTWLGGRDRDLVLAAIASLVTRTQRRRLNKARRAALAAATLAAKRERDIQGLWRSADFPLEGQPGLFDSRERRHIEAQIEAASRLVAAGRVRAADLAGAADLRLGTASIELVLTDRR